ncbi:MAG TPA: helix-turn-helix domain-containing protein [Polyangiaceae bacterium]
MRIVLVGFEGAQGLDIFGPAEVFAGANRSLGRIEYQVALCSEAGGQLRTTCGISVLSERLSRVRPRLGDTVLVVGGEEKAIRAALASVALVRWLSNAAPVVRRIGSVCSGAFVLARAGILDGLRATTHWSVCRELSVFRSQVTVEPDAIFVQEGKVWTSAGVTTGIDMSLSLVEQDFGRRVADSVAARLVVYARRPGFQSQFSETLISQTGADEALSRAFEGLRRQPARRASVDQLARAAGMSRRTLHRRCVAEMGTTPAKLIERLCVEQARLLINRGLSAKVVAARSGFDNPVRMARAFQRTLGVSPSSYRALFSRD